MKRSTIILLVALGAIVLWAINFQRGMVGMDEGVAAQWSNVENAYQLRADKTKNIVEIIKGSADFEKSTLTEVIEARAKATSIQLKADDLTPENLAKFEEAQQQLSGALSRLMVTVERYPDLKTTTAFRDFQAQYEGMENRIGVERRKFNDLAREYNAKIKRIPNNLLAGLFGFGEKAYFKAQEGTDVAPDISFTK
ncbi:MAG TPA: LemA family protein [Flavobacteriales bacterium]|nr:LemA family protein [Flavobacteriales bacterium]HRO39202.1 LemA family protein [Flavobacteriales bacterium]HRP81715.1 LemA family protein [Flavobacteriales bacterium]HRQ85956.1 LemA family protein [Flavobacteriales bacterium]